MSPSVTIVDYGSGNLLSVMRAFERCGAAPILTQDPAEIARADRLVLPGVGAFADGMQGLRARGLVEPIQHYGASGKPLLGICLGMQMLATSSLEFGEHAGLGLIAGRVVPLANRSTEGETLKIPNVGWSELSHANAQGWAASPLDGLAQGAAVYLVHSFHVVPDRPADLLAQYDHGGHSITAAVRAGRIFGCQFHPEKSGEVGLAILARFLGL